MTEFTAAGWFEIRGRGWVASIAGIDDFDPRTLVSQQVEVDGKSYVVRGVETFAIANVSGKPFGLLVGER